LPRTSSSTKNSKMHEATSSLGSLLFLLHIAEISRVLFRVYPETERSLWRADLGAIRWRVGGWQLAIRWLFAVRNFVCKRSSAGFGMISCCMIYFNKLSGLELYWGLSRIHPEVVSPRVSISTISLFASGWLLRLRYTNVNSILPKLYTVACTLKDCIIMKLRCLSSVRQMTPNNMRSGWMTWCPSEATPQTHLPIEETLDFLLHIAVRPSFNCVISASKLVYKCL
jgi:hypothetical protein